MMRGYKNNWLILVNLSIYIMIEGKKRCKETLCSNTWTTFESSLAMDLSS